MTDEHGPERFGSFIEKHRREKRLTAYQLGKALDFPTHYVSGVENGDIWPSDRFVDACAEFFGVPHEFLEAMLGEKEAPKREDHVSF